MSNANVGKEKLKQQPNKSSARFSHLWTALDSGLVQADRSIDQSMSAMWVAGTPSGPTTLLLS